MSKNLYEIGGYCKALELSFIDILEKLENQTDKEKGLISEDKIKRILLKCITDLKNDTHERGGIKVLSSIFGFLYDDKDSTNQYLKKLIEFNRSMQNRINKLDSKKLNEGDSTYFYVTFDNVIGLIADARKHSSDVLSFYGLPMRPREINNFKIACIKFGSKLLGISNVDLKSLINENKRMKENFEKNPRVVLSINGRTNADDYTGSDWKSLEDYANTTMKDAIENKCGKGVIPEIKVCVSNPKNISIIFLLDPLINVDDAFEVLDGFKGDSPEDAHLHTYWTSVVFISKLRETP